MLKIEGKTFMNLQEAVQWLLDNNALTFQSSASYIANTEIGLGTIANPSPAKVKIGSLILFADSKVATVTGLTDTSFIVGTQVVDFKTALAYILSIVIDASGKLITTLSDGTVIDAGIVKQVSGFSIVGGHLVVTYNDGTSADLGAIFTGNVTISGDLTVAGNYIGNIPFERIVDLSNNNRFIEGPITENPTTGVTHQYNRWSLSGTHLMMVDAIKVDANTSLASYSILATINIPSWVGAKIATLGSSGDWVNVHPQVANRSDGGLSTVTKNFMLRKVNDSSLQIFLVESLNEAQDLYFRIEFDLLIDNA